jgi:hypothetical protein
MTVTQIGEAAEKALTAKAKRLAKRHGFAMVKGRGQFCMSNRLQYMLLDKRNSIVAGPRFDLTAQDVMDFLEEL